jgi:arylsulfatase A-like enzyme
LRLIGQSGAGDSIKQRVLLEYPESLARAMMIRTQDWKLIYRLDGDRELYDLRSDGNELRNLYGDPDCAWIRGDLLERMLKFSIRTQRDLPELASVWA